MTALLRMRQVMTNELRYVPPSRSLNISDKRVNPSKQTGTFTNEARSSKRQPHVLELAKRTDLCHLLRQSSCTKDHHFYLGPQPSQLTSYALPNLPSTNIRSLHRNLSQAQSDHKTRINRNHEVQSPALLRTHRRAIYLKVRS